MRSMNIKNIILTALLGVSVIQAASAVKRDVFSELTQDPQIESTYVSGKFDKSEQQIYRSLQLSMLLGGCCKEGTQHS